MEMISIVRVDHADEDGIIVHFSDGKSALYSTTLLKSVAANAKDLATPNRPPDSVL